MLNLIVSIAKKIGGPGSLGLFVLLLVAGLVLLRTRRRAGVTGLLVLLLVYGLLSLPAVSGALEDSLGPPPSGSGDLVTPGQRTTLVVLGGDNDVGRDREVARLLDQLHPARAVVLGDEGIGRTVREARLPGLQIIEDAGPGTTRAQIAAVTRLPHLPDDHIVLVASRLQMPRVLGLARAAHLEIIPVVSDVNHPLPGTGWRHWLPSVSALQVSRDALYERAALAYYRWRGWIH